MRFVATLLAAALVGFVAAFAALHWGQLTFWQAIIIGWLAGLAFNVALLGWP